jgi:hypothetical protein
VVIVNADMVSGLKVPFEYRFTPTVYRGRRQVVIAVSILNNTPCSGRGVGGPLSHPIYKNINRAIIYAPGSSHAYIQQIIKISQHMS